MKGLKRVIAMLLALCLILTLLPKPVLVAYAEDDVPADNALEGKTIACIGDSITAAYGVTKDETDYVTLLAGQLGMDYIRLGDSGTTLCTDGSRTCNIRRLTEDCLQGADVVTIAMGINDFCAAAEGYYELGDINSTDTSTIYGAARMWCQRIKELRGTDSLSHTQFYFVTPVITSWNNSVTSARDWDQSKTNIHGYTLRDLCNTIMEVAALYDVAVIDLNLLSGMYYVDAQDNNTAVFGGDGVHPGEKGHEMMAAAMANVLLQNNLRDDHTHTFGSWITTTWPSCTAGEQKRVCTICSATESRALELHNYSAVVTAPTCTEQGYTTHTCSACGDSYVDDHTDATGHSYDSIVCTVCGDTLAGKTISILGDSISTYTGVSNDASVNATLSGGAIYYNAGTLGVYRADTWWQQIIDTLGLELLVNNSWSGSAVLHTRSGAVGAYVDRCVQLHNTAGEEPDIIAVFLGTNDYSYYQSSLGTADIDYAALITDNSDGTYTYATPATTCEAYAIMLHKMVNRYPDTEVYCLGLLPRRNPDHDGKDVVPAPTQFNGELKEVIGHFGCHYVDIESPIPAEAAQFDKYITDQRVHPGPLGMDVMTQALIDTMLGQKNASCTVSRNLTNVTADTSGNIVLKGGTYQSTLSANAGFDALTVTVTMGGTDVTASVYKDGTVNIPAVTGDVVITASASVDDTPDNYRWEVDGDSFVNVAQEGYTSNSVTKKAGTVSSGVVNNAYFQLEKPVVLRHDQPWVVQWHVGGASWSGMLFSTNATSNSAGNSYLFKTTSNTGFIGFGEPVSGNYYNYGIALGAQGVDTTAEHTYRVENRIAEDGSNMAYLLVDGVDYGPMNHYFIGGNSDQGEQVDWLSGRDLVFSYIGSSGHALNNCKLKYLAVWENHTHSYESVVTAPTCTEKGYTTYTCTTCGDSYVDSYVDAKGHSYENGMCTVCGAKIETPVWEQGTIAYATGLDKDGATRLRTVGYLKLSDYGMVDVETGYELVRFVYDQNHKLLSATNWLGSGVGVYMTELQTQYPQGVYFRVAMRATDDRELTLADLQTAGVTFYAPGEEPEKPFWEIGTIAAADGLDTANTTRLRTVGYLSLSDYAAVTVNAGYEITYLAYDRNFKYLGNGSATKTGNWLGSGIGITSADICTLYADAACFRLALRKTDSSKLTLDAATDSGIRFYGVGEDVPAPKTGWSQKAVMIANSSQDGAIYNGNVFLFNGSGTCTVYSLSGKTKIGSFTLDQQNLLKPHANSVCFGDTFYAEGDKYPLLYVNIYNNYSSATDRMEGTCCVYRLTETDGVFSTELVQVIRIGFVNDLELWKSKENNGDIRPYGNFVVDTDNDSLYAFVMRDAQKKTRFFRFELPGLTEGVYNETYGCKVVTLESGDIVSRFDTAYMNYMQGCCYGDGRILSVEGFGAGTSALPVLRVIDLQTRTMVATVDLTENGLNKEPEMICDYNGEIYYAAADGVLRILNLDELHYHSYTSVVTAPTCTEQGYTTHTCSACGDSYVDDYMDAIGHIYENGICTVCDVEHPNMANFEGKVISILGDSISTFAGYIPTADGFNLEHLARYPQDNLLTDVNETWWMQVVSAVGAKLGINDSWRGATVSGAHAVTTGSTGENAAMHNLTRIQNLGSNGTPDVILFYGGTNDLAHVSKVGTFDAENAPSAVDLTTAKWDNLADGYVHTLLRLQYFYPDAQIIAMLPTYTNGYYSDEKLAEGNAVLAAICEHYGVTYVDLRECGISVADLPDNIHPDAIGMDYITAAVIDAMLNTCEMEPGENVVRSVTHELLHAESSAGYYKGVSHGKPFEARITGEDVKVTITMGGADITNAVYADGVVSIAEVTGDIVITAEGRIKTVYEDHLQQLPAGFCAGINLWTTLEHDAQYYTASGWGIHSSGTVYSVTFPVCAGNQIYATSFGPAGNNGGSINGIRATWFDENGVLESMSADEVYTEFSANGYLSAPESAVAISIPMWNNSNENELYILNAEHDYVSEVTMPACTTEGYTTHICSTCGDSYTDDEKAALGHDLDEWEVAQDATCIENGTKRRDCSRCDHFETEAIEAGGHVYEAVVTAPSCTEKGYTTHTCSACGDSYTDDEKAELGHDMGEWEVTQNATCIENGTKRRDCSRCDHFETEAIEAKGHSYSSVITAPSCTEKGYTTHTCSACGDSYTDDEKVALGHEWSVATCTEAKTCSVCKATEGKPNGHIYDDDVDGSCNACSVKRENVERRIVVHMFRMYNPNTGEHFYTGSELERENLIVAGWQYEGVGFTFPANTGAPVHRLFQPSTGEHLYTMDEDEMSRLIAEGWNYEGIAFNSAYDTEAVQHRLHNPNATVGAYHFTFSEEEMQNLIAAGWEYQGIGWYSCWK